MKFSDLYQNLKKLRVFSTQDIFLWEKDFRLANLDRWQEEGKIIQLKRGWYFFSDLELKELDYYLVANRIYQPSYVSLETALSYYGIIPEAVRQIISVTPNKTGSFENKLGVFQYYSIKKDLNFGYKIVENEDQGIKMAHLEKAILDLFYLRSDIKSVEDLEFLRFNKQILSENLDYFRLDSYVPAFDSTKIDQLVVTLKEYLHA